MVYDALTGNYVGAYENIIDPAKVLKVAFMNAINTIYQIKDSFFTAKFANMIYANHVMRIKIIQNFKVPKISSKIKLLTQLFLSNM